MRVWRNRVDYVLRRYLESVISESSKHKSAYRLASRPDNAQLWIAVANLSKQINDLNTKLNYLEGVLVDIARRKNLVGKKSEVKKVRVVAKKNSKKRSNRKLEKSLRRY